MIAVTTAILTVIIGWALNFYMHKTLLEQNHQLELERRATDAAREEQRRKDDFALADRRRKDDVAREDQRRKDDFAREDQRRKDEIERQDEKRRYDFQLDARRQAYGTLMAQVHSCALSAQRDLQEAKQTAAAYDELEAKWVQRTETWVRDLAIAYYSADSLAGVEVRNAATEAYLAVQELGVIRLSHDNKDLLDALKRLYDHLDRLRAAARDELREEVGERVFEPRKDALPQSPQTVDTVLEIAQKTPKLLKVPQEFLIEPFDYKPFEYRPKG